MAVMISPGGCGSSARLRPNHPSTETRQLQWEKEMEKASRQIHRNIHQHEAGQICKFDTSLFLFGVYLTKNAVYIKNITKTINIYKQQK